MLYQPIELLLKPYDGKMLVIMRLNDATVLHEVMAEVTAMALYNLGVLRKWTIKHI